MMHLICRVGVVTLILAWTPPASVAQAQAGEATARRLADSLARLDPGRELQAALKRGDGRLLVICADICTAPSIGSADSIAKRHSWRALRVLAGPSDAITGPEMRRLNAVAWQYCERYNQLLNATRPLK